MCLKYWTLHLLTVGEVLSFASSVYGQAETSPEFSRYRPSYHFQPPKNWMNDPCAPMKTPDGKYHLFYQYNPYDAIWGNMTWGHASSSDLIHWEDEVNALVPDQVYDHLGIFSGSGITKGYQGKPTIGYTAVSKLPISWKIEYPLDAEQQALAYTNDNGATWEKIGIVISTPPEVARTGFRDPYLFRSPTFDALLSGNNSTSEYVYMTLSGGTNATKKGGRLWLYKSQDWIDWEPLPTPFYSASGDQRIGKFSEHTLGYNWEMANYFVLSETPAGSQEEWHTIIIGVEGTSVYDTIRWPVWTMGRIKLADDSIQFVPEISGILDNGIDYADNSFFDPTTQQRVLWGWVTEDDSDNKEIREAQGWAGMLTVPREIYLFQKHGVLFTNQLLNFTGGLHFAWDEVQHTNVVSTLGIRPAKELELLRDAVEVEMHDIEVEQTRSFYHVSSGKRNYEISAVFDFSRDPTAEAGITVMRSEDGREETVILYDPVTSRFTIDRSRSSMNPLYSNATQWGEFPLFHTENGLEKLELRVFVDNSVVEVFANDRFALTTRIYPTLHDSTQVALTLARGKGVRVDAFSLWPITDRAFPNRK
ncbi:Arabinanase/levansucrase/invertase [Basidiobolus meristosporus CBS 931.73]|uniref:Arabinanase/levansucrase/invertase n=1 Tax=Basidiobolus meristosporus CBS 931.73 TaxID=1314790 RepID=A0A1Y1Y079_9FUNG|nr:Arabinanase/levansucrase/invertase [Basidiobolus meristosporus CBS 931.73]|eukprot:ORX91305.1 Arabinanase/levansucrase/invertase [Basidiobolus meristosporus CBS 931.73]